MSTKPFVVGVGVIAFRKPGSSEPYDIMGAEATQLALRAAGIHYGDIEQAYVGYVYGDSPAGQQALYRVGMTGIPIVNVNNACVTGSTALFLARQAVQSGAVDVALALGFEPALFFGGAGAEHQQRYGTKDATFAMIAVKARRHAANNPLALFRDPLSVDEVLASRPIYGPLTRYQCCPPTCGAAAAIVVSDTYARQPSLTDRAVEIVAQTMTTDPGSSFDRGSMMRIVGCDMAREAASQLYEKSRHRPRGRRCLRTARLLHDQ